MISRFIKELYFLAILILSMRGSVFYHSRIAIIVRLLAAIFVLLIYKIKITNALFKLLGIWSLFVAVSTLVAGRFIPLAFLTYTMYFFEAYVVIKLFECNFFRLFVKWVAVLSFISLIGWLLTLFYGRAFYELLKPFDLSGGFRYWADDYAHLIIYTVRPTVSLREMGFPRNAGFTWEPGPFAIILILAIFANWSILKRNKASISSMIFLFALATTFSTTGYLTFFSYLAYALLSKSKRIIYIVPLVVLLYGGVYIFNELEFLGNKVKSYSEKEASFQSDVSGSVSYSGSRLAGLPIVIQDLSKNPIMGKALASEGEYQGVGLIRSVHLNALFSITSSMGLFGIFWWLYFMINSSVTIGLLNSPYEKYTLLLILTLSSFGFNIHTWSIIWVFILYTIFVPKKHEMDSVLDSSPSNADYVLKGS